MNKSYYLDLIAKQTNVQNVIYVAVGSVAYSEPLHDTHNQQYPKFLKKIKITYPNINIHIFLIDPLLENPPCVTTMQKFTKLNDDMYYDEQENITLYAFRDCVRYPWIQCLTTSGNIVDYNPFFDKLNNYAILNNWLVVVCDYSGSYVKDWRNQYENVLNYHVNHIIYGLFVDDEKTNSCCLDMQSPDCDFVTHEDNKIIKIFNPYSYDNNYPFIFPDCLQKQNQIITKNIKAFLGEKKQVIRNIFNFFKDIHISISKKQSMNEHCINNANFILQKYKMVLNCSNYDDANYKQIVNIVQKIFVDELEKYVKMIYFEDSKQIIDEKLKAMFKESDPYKWNKYFNDLYFDYDTML